MTVIAIERRPTAPGARSTPSSTGGCTATPRSTSVVRSVRTTLALAANGPARGTLQQLLDGSHPVHLSGLRGELERLLRHDQRHVDRNRGAEALWRRQGRLRLQLAPGRPRFDIAANPNEIHRFGWCVEIDPQAPELHPRSCGRRSGGSSTRARWSPSPRVASWSTAATTRTRSTSTSSSGSAPGATERAQGNSPFDNGCLTSRSSTTTAPGEWLPWCTGGALTVANGGPTRPMCCCGPAPRPTPRGHADGSPRVDHREPAHRRCLLHAHQRVGSAQRGQPADAQPYGHIIRWQERRNDKTGTAFDWGPLRPRRDPAYDSRVTIKGGQVRFPGRALLRRRRAPVDPDRHLEQQPEPGVEGYDGIGNNMMLAADPRTGETRRFLTGPRGCEITGVVTTPDQRTMFVNVQHPGESTTAWGTPTPANPARSPTGRSSTRPVVPVPRPS